MAEHHLYLGDELGRVLRFLAAFQARHGWMPSVAELRDGLGYPSTSTVVRRLEQLEQAGRIVRGPHGAARCIRIVKPE